MRRDPDAGVAQTRPRYSRMAAAAGAVLVTAVSVLGGIGVLPTSASAAAPALSPHGAAGARSGTTPSALPTGRSTSGSADGGAMSLAAGVPSAKPGSARTADQDTAPTLPRHSGSGRRIVFDISAQRVWLVGQKAGHDVVRRTYLVSGSLTDNLHPGTYAVYSRSMHAIGVDDSGTMEYFVRFTHGSNAAIGFHDIPVLNGHQVQTRAQLGHPESHGCIRQWRPDAQALWAFAPLGTKVTVVA